MSLLDATEKVVAGSDKRKRLRMGTGSHQGPACFIRGSEHLKYQIENFPASIIKLSHQLYLHTTIEQMNTVGKKAGIAPAEPLQG